MLGILGNSMVKWARQIFAKLGVMLSLFNWKQGHCQSGHSWMICYSFQESGRTPEFGHKREKLQKYLSPSPIFSLHLNCNAHV